MTPIAERDANGNLIASYTRGVGYGGGIGSIVSKNTPKFNKKGVLTKYTSQYYHYDAIGNVSNLSGPGGNATATYVYDAFGNELRAKGKQSDDNPYHFSTKETDSTGLVYFGARYYDPTIGRWITKDPMGMIDGPNMYNYVNNNPVNFIDPWGLCAEDNKDSLGDRVKNAIKDFDPNYGNWGGNNWSGGEYIEAGELGNRNVSATDSLDELYKTHDVDTYDGNPSADSDLARNLRNLSNNPYTWNRKPKNKVYAIVHKKLAETWFRK